MMIEHVIQDLSDSIKELTAAIRIAHGDATPHKPLTPASDPTPASPARSAAPKPAPEKKAAPKLEEPDAEFITPEPTPEAKALDYDKDVKPLILEVSAKLGRAAAVAINGEFGVKIASELKAKDYAAFIGACKAALAAEPYA